MTNNPKLNDLQLVLLSTAAQRDNGGVFPVAESIAKDQDRVRKAVQSLLKRSLVAIDASLEPIRRSPLYEQVAERLRGFIDAQRLQPGDRLMSERELAVQLGVSRTSVRQALTALKVMGLVEIRHGDGVYLLRSPRDLVPSLATEIVDSEVDHPMIWEVREGIEVSV